MIVALARKLLVALWRMVTLGEEPEGMVLRTPTGHRCFRKRCLKAVTVGD